jgi:ankyrin repeat protein
MSLFETGLSALMVSCQMGHEFCVEALVSPYAYSPANPDARCTSMSTAETSTEEENGFTALMFAAMGGQKGCVEVRERQTKSILLWF